MPRAETYEQLLLGPLRGADVTWLRLSTPAYASSDRERIDRVYVPLGAALEERALDGLIITGAPVEALPFEAVTYWDELSSLLERAREVVASTLGLCWGALALGHLLGIDKIVFEQKLFGVYPLEVVDSQHPILGGLSPRFLCPQSRYSGLSLESVNAAVGAGRARVLAESHEAGPVLVESSDRRFLIHTGHPEYDADRLRYEYCRDTQAGVRGVGKPHNFDLENPRAIWRQATEQFFGAWLTSLRSRNE